MRRCGPVYLAIAGGGGGLTWSCRPHKLTMRISWTDNQESLDWNELESLYRLAPLGSAQITDAVHLARLLRIDLERREGEGNQSLDTYPRVRGARARCILAKVARTR